MSKILENSEQARTSAKEVIKDFSSFMHDNPDFSLITTKLSSLSRKHISRLLETPEHWAHTPNGLTAMILVNTGLNKTNVRSKSIVNSAMLVLQQFIEETIGENHLACLPVFLDALENIRDEDLVDSLIDLITQACWTLDGKQIDLGGARVISARSLETLTPIQDFPARFQDIYHDGPKFDPNNPSELEQVEYRSQQLDDQDDIYSRSRLVDTDLTFSVMDSIHQDPQLNDDTFLNRFLTALWSHSEAMSVYARRTYAELSPWNDSSFVRSCWRNTGTDTLHAEVLYRFLDMLNAPTMISDELRSKLKEILHSQVTEFSHVAEEAQTDVELSYLDYLTDASQDESSS